MTQYSKHWKLGKSHGTRAGRAVCPGRNFGRVLERDGAEWTVYRPIAVMGELEIGDEREEDEQTEKGQD